MKETLIVVGILIFAVCLKALFRGKARDMTRISTPSENISTDEIKNLVQAGRKIEAIKLYRAQTGLGLKEAKLAVDQMEISDSNQQMDS